MAAGKPPLQRIGVIADTHDRFDPRIPELFAGVDRILHAGDICGQWVLDELYALAPVTVVLGNNDCLSGLREVERPVLNGVRFHMVHIPPRRPPAHADWLVFGHTHVPMDTAREGVRWFNPGSAGMANKGAPRSVAVLHWRGGAWEPELTVL